MLIEHGTNEEWSLTIWNYMTISNHTWKQHFYITRLGKQKMIFSFTWLKKRNPDINWQTGKIKWWQLEGNEECIRPSNGVCVNKSSKETTWTKPLASEPSCANYMEYWKATIEEESDTEEWIDSFDEPLVNGPFSDDLDDFNNITYMIYWYRHKSHGTTHGIIDQCHTETVRHLHFQI